MNKLYHLCAVYGVLTICVSFGCKRTEKSDEKSTLFSYRFEQDLFEISPQFIFDSLPKLKDRYSPFFESTNDEFWRNILLDSTQLRLYAHVRETFEDISVEKQSVKSLLDKYIHHYKPAHKNFYLYTYISNLDFDYPVIVSDSNLFLALDLYLGADFPAYAYLPRYLAAERDRRYIPIDVALSIAESMINPTANNAETLLSYMIREGILLYTTKKLLPKEKEKNIFKYSDEQWDFCVSNERNIWLYFINNKLLFDTNIMTKKKFIDPAPFTKMGTDFDREIPGRIGRWIGYRIVSEFMKKNKDISPRDLLQITDYNHIFYKSNYKPN